MSAEELLDSVLLLPRDERAAIACELIKSLAPDEGQDALDPELAAELERRIAKYEAGEVQATDWRESLERIRQAVRGGKNL
ncbi:MAG: addiction module protein [Gemmataceae bacterium]